VNNIILLNGKKLRRIKSQEKINLALAENYATDVDKMNEIKSQLNRSATN
jgi:hypothetical protein